MSNFWRKTKHAQNRIVFDAKSYKRRHHTSVEDIEVLWNVEKGRSVN